MRFKTTLFLPGEHLATKTWSSSLVLSKLKLAIYTLLWGQGLFLLKNP